MIKEIKKITNKNLDFLNTEKNHLSIQFSLDGFSFCVLDKVTREVACLSEYEFSNNKTNLEDELLQLTKEVVQKEEVILRKKYSSTSISYFNNKVTQVPLDYFDESKKNDYLKLSVNLNQDSKVTFDTIESLNFCNVYASYSKVTAFLKGIYGEETTSKHSSSIVLSKIFEGYKEASKELCVINVHKEHFEIIIFKNQKLALYNSFQFSTKEDFLYYILFVMKQVDINPAEAKIILLGDIRKGGEFYTLLYRYIKQVQFHNPLNFPVILKGSFYTHSHFALLNQY